MNGARDGGRAGGGGGVTVVYQWANVKGVHGMATPAYLESHGFVKVRQHPLYPLSWLMRKDAA